MATTNNLISVLPGTFSQDNEHEISVPCHEEDKLDEISCFSFFTLRLDEDNHCSVSVFGDDAFFFDDDCDNVSTASSIDESYRIEDLTPDDIPRSTRNGSETDRDTETMVVQREERERKPLMTRRPLRERRRGGKRPTRSATPAASTTALRGFATD